MEWYNLDRIPLFGVMNDGPDRPSGDLNRSKMKPYRRSIRDGRFKSQTGPTDSPD